MKYGYDFEQKSKSKTPGYSQVMECVAILLFGNETVSLIH